MKKQIHIASCSFGKDSIATILLALENNEPLDRVVFSEVMFDISRNISGETMNSIMDKLVDNGYLFKDARGLFWCDKFKEKLTKKMLKL